MKNYYTVFIFYRKLPNLCNVDVTSIFSLKWKHLKGQYRRDQSRQGMESVS